MGKGGQNPEAHNNNASKLKKISFQELSKHRTIEDGKSGVYFALLIMFMVVHLGLFFPQLGSHIVEKFTMFQIGKTIQVRESRFASKNSDYVFLVL
jgi:hypothetical protein